MVSVSRIGSRFRAEFLARVATAVSGAVLTIGLARLLDPSGYGLLYWAIAFVGITRLFAKFGIGSSAARYISDYRETDARQIPHIIKWSFLVSVILSFVVAGVIVVGHRRIAVLLGDPDLAPFLLVAAPFLVFTTLGGYFRKIFQGFEDIRMAALVSGLRGTSKLPLAVGLALGFGAIGALVGYALGAALSALVGGVYVYSRYYRGSESAAVMEPGLKQRIAEYAVPLTATEGANIVDKEIDTVLVGFLLNSVAVSYYVIAKQIVKFLQTPVSALGFTLAPTFGSEKSAGNTDHAARIYEEALVHSLLLYTPAAIGIVLIAEPMINLFFGADYVGAVPILQVLGLHVMLQSINLVASKALDFLGRARERAIVKGATSVLNAGLNLLLIPQIGVVGAAIATIVTYSLYAVANVYIIHQELPIRVGYILTEASRIVAVSLAMGATVFLLVGRIDGFVSLFSVVGVGVLVWAGLSTATGMLDVRRVYSTVMG